MILNQENKIRSKQKGVALVFFLFVLGILLGFFMLIANTGMLVYQKIRLQTAVDLASYAGASVQASYLGNQSSGPDSVKNLNFEIFKRYQELVKELQDRPPPVWPQMIPGGLAGAAVCAALCMASNYAQAKQVESAYKKAARDMDVIRQKMLAIMDQLPKASQKAAEETLRLNIPELAMDGNDPLGSFFGETTADVTEVIRSNKQSGANKKSKNAVLSFSSMKGLYLANVVASVPHTFAYFGLASTAGGCYPLRESDPSMYGQPNYWYCAVNGSGFPGGQKGYNAAALAYALAATPTALSGNVGTIATISDSNKAAIRLNFIQNHARPDPFFISAAEWYPKNGSYMNLENSFGANGSLFPKKTRLVAVSAAEPFGTSLAMGDGTPFGVRLQSIRKLLLDPRMEPVKGDFPGLYDYMESLAPTDASGRQTEKAEDVIRRFLH